MKHWTVDEMVAERPCHVCTCEKIEAMEAARAVADVLTVLQEDATCNP